MSGRVLIVGFDAVAGDLAMRWMREGKLPTLAALAARGTLTPLRSQGEHTPESSWTSLTTGTSPGEHGLYNWRIVRPGTVDRSRMPGGGWVRPFWSVLREQSPEPKPKAVIFDVPYSGGLRDDGVLEVGGWGLRFTRQASSWPPGLFEELRSRHGASPDWINRDWERGPYAERRYRRIMRKLTRRRADLILDLLSRTDWSLGLVNFVETHNAGHAFHHHIEAAEPRRRRARYGAPSGLLDVYREADRNLARIVEAVGPGTDVIVVSTVGLRPNETSKELIRNVMVSLGYQVPVGSPDRGRAMVTRVATRVLPRFVRHQIRRLIPGSTAEAVDDREWGGSIDWSRSRAVSEAEAGSSWIRLNLEGREPEGIVPASEREALLAEITADIEALIDPATGEPAALAVVPIDEIAPGTRMAQMPELLVRWKPGKRISRVIHPRVGAIDDGGGAYARTEHDGSGFLVAAGPRIAAGEPPAGTRAPNEFDIAPTVLHLFGCPIPAAMQGEVLDWLLVGDRQPRRAEIDISSQPGF